MLNKGIRWFIVLSGLLNLAYCIYSWCVGKWEVSCYKFTTSILFFLLALYDWVVERRFSVTRQKWFRNGWIQCQSTIDEKLLRRYRLLLQWKQSTTNPRVDEVNHIRCHILYSLWYSLRNKMINDNFKHYDNES